MNGPLPQHFFVRKIENYCKQNLFNMPFGTKKTGIYQISKLKRLYVKCWGGAHYK